MVEKTLITYAKFLDFMGFPDSDGDGKVSFEEAQTKQNWLVPSTLQEQGLAFRKIAVISGDKEIIEESDFRALIKNPSVLGNLLSISSPDVSKTRSPVTHRRYVACLQLALNLIFYDGGNELPVDGDLGEETLDHRRLFASIVPGLRNDDSQTGGVLDLSLSFYLNEYPNHIDNLEDIILRLKANRNHMIENRQEYQQVETPVVGEISPDPKRMNRDHALVMALQYLGYTSYAAEHIPAWHIGDKLLLRYGDRNITPELLTSLIDDLETLRDDLTDPLC